MERDNRMDDKLDGLLPQGDAAPEEGQDPAGGRAKRDGSASRDLYLNVRVLVGMMAVAVAASEMGRRIHRRINERQATFCLEGPWC